MDHLDEINPKRYLSTAYLCTVYIKVDNEVNSQCR